MEEKQETESENGIRNFSSRIRKSALDLIVGIKHNRQEAEPEYRIEHETGKEERKEKIEQLQMRTAAGIILFLCFCCLPVVAAETIQPEGISKAATASEATVSEAGTLDSERKTESVQTQSYIADGFHKNHAGKWNYYKNGMVVKNTWEQEDGIWYYMDASGCMASNCWQQVNGTWYYFDPDGALHDGWLLYHDEWYYMTDAGMVTGYVDIPDEEDSNSFYFYEDGRLAVNTATPDGRAADSDGYLMPPDGTLPAFLWDASGDPSVGTLSGLTIAGMPAEFYMLSIAGETSGGQIIMGDRGRAYGICQFDYRYDLTDFIRYAYGKHPGLWAELSAYLNAVGGDETLVGNTALRDAFSAAMARSYEAAITDQLEYMRARYWDVFQKRMDEAGYQLSTRHIAVQAAFFSVNVNCGTQTDLYLSEIRPDLTDAEMICRLYTLRNTVLAEQNVGRHKKGTTARYRQYEPQMALDLLHGYVTIDSKKTYGGGVSWCGNIFASGIISTAATEGTSTEWLVLQAEETPAAETDPMPETATASEASTSLTGLEQGAEAGQGEDSKTEQESDCGQVLTDEQEGQDGPVTDNDQFST